MFGFGEVVDYVFGEAEVEEFLESGGGEAGEEGV